MACEFPPSLDPCAGPDRAGISGDPPFVSVAPCLGVKTVPPSPSLPVAANPVKGCLEGPDLRIELLLELGQASAGVESGDLTLDCVNTAGDVAQ